MLPQKLCDKVTVVIPVCVGHYCVPHEYRNVRVLLLSNGEGPLYVNHAEVLRVPWQGHARTRRRALKYIQTPYVFFTVQDATPHEGMLLTLLCELERGLWDIVLPRQLAHAYSCDIVRQQIEAWMPAADQTYPFPQADHVGALYRTEDLRQWALADAPIAEDVWWSIGRRIGCVPQAKLSHAHEREAWPLYCREYAIHTQLAILQRLKRPSLKALLGVHKLYRGQVGDWVVDTMEQLGRWRAWLRI